MKKLFLFAAMLVIVVVTKVQGQIYQVTDLGYIHYDDTVRANAINQSGQVVGHGYYNSGHQHAFLYSDGSMLDLGTLGGLDSAATGINANGQVVGWSQNSDGQYCNFLYSEGIMLDLNSLIDTNSGWTLFDSYGGRAPGNVSINDSGQIVGLGVNPIGLEHAFLLNEIPEPTTLLPLGLFTLLLWRRR